MELRPEYHARFLVMYYTCNLSNTLQCSFSITCIYFILIDMICSFMTPSMASIQKLVRRAAVRSNLYGFAVMSELSNVYIV